MDPTHDDVALYARSLLAALLAADDGRGGPSHGDVVQRLELLLVERGLPGPVCTTPTTTRHRADATHAFSAAGTLLAFGCAWGDLFPLLLDIRLIDQGSEDAGPETAGDLDADHAFLLQIARSHLAVLADGVDPMSGIDYDEPLERLDALYPAFVVPPILPVPAVPRQISYDAVAACVRQLAWVGDDPAELVRVRDLLEAAWAAEGRGVVVGDAS